MHDSRHEINSFYRPAMRYVPFNLSIVSKTEDGTLLKPIFSIRYIHDVYLEAFRRRQDFCDTKHFEREQGLRSNCSSHDLKKDPNSK